MLFVLDADRVADAVPHAKDWHANQLWFVRRKCLLLTYAATLFPDFEADVAPSRCGTRIAWSPDLIERDSNGRPAAGHVRETAAGRT